VKQNTSYTESPTTYPLLKSVLLITSTQTIR